MLLQSRKQPVDSIEVSGDLHPPRVAPHRAGDEILFDRLRSKAVPPFKHRHQRTSVAADVPATSRPSTTLRPPVTWPRRAESSAETACSVGNLN